MMKRLFAVLALVMLAHLGAVGVLEAAQGGGFPARPRFQSIGVGTAVPAGSGNLAISGSMTAGTVPDARLSANIARYTDLTPSFGGSGVSDVNFNATAAGTGRASINVNISGTEALCLVGNASASLGGCNMPAGEYGLMMFGGTPINIRAAGGVRVNGVPFVAAPKIAYATIGGTGSCSINTAGGQTSQNISGCSYSGTGAYGITFSGFSTTPVCTMNQWGSVSASSTTAGSVVRYNSAGALADGLVNIICMGT